VKYRILKDFKGSQDGRFAEDFLAGTVAELSDYLVSCAPPGAIAAAEEAAPAAPASVHDDKPRRAKRPA
jgi:hypothetical protein